jgi:hypothetical protein
MTLFDLIKDHSLEDVSLDSSDGGHLPFQYQPPLSPDPISSSSTSSSTSSKGDISDDEYSNSSVHGGPLDPPSSSAEHESEDRIPLGQLSFFIWLSLTLINFRILEGDQCDPI